jgi:hypothetical protein
LSILARLVATVREAAAERMHWSLAEAAADAEAELPYRLVDCCACRTVPGPR